MSKTILANVDGWTPLMEELVQKYGVIVAAVFGRAWRYCQMESGVCTASQETIAGELKLSRKTVNEHLQTLVKGGYLKDLTPNLKNKTHTYADTGKVVMKATISAVTQSDTTVTKGYSDGNEKLQQGVTESYSKKGRLRNNLRDSSNAETLPEKPKRERDSRLDNPAMIAYRKETQLYVPISWRDEIVKTVVNWELWETVIHNWVGSGWNRQNIKGMLEVYRNGGFSNGKNGNGHKPAAQPAAPVPTEEDLQREREECRARIRAAKEEKQRANAQPGA